MTFDSTFFKYYIYYSSNINTTKNSTEFHKTLIILIKTKEHHNEEVWFICRKPEYSDEFFWISWEIIVIWNDKILVHGQIHLNLSITLTSIWCILMNFMREKIIEKLPNSAEISEFTN